MALPVAYSSESPILLRGFVSDSMSVQRSPAPGKAARESDTSSIDRRGDGTSYSEKDSSDIWTEQKMTGRAHPSKVSEAWISWMPRNCQFRQVIQSSNSI